MSAQTRAHAGLGTTTKDRHRPSLLLSINLINHSPFPRLTPPTDSTTPPPLSSPTTSLALNMRASLSLSPVLLLLSSALPLSSPSPAVAQTVAADACVSFAVDLNAKIPALAVAAVHVVIPAAQLSLRLCLCLDLTVSASAQTSQLNSESSSHVGSDTTASVLNHLTFFPPAPDYINSTPLLAQLSGIIGLPSVRSIVLSLVSSRASRSNVFSGYH